MAQLSDFKIAIGIWTAQGTIRKHQFRDFYIHIMDFTYPYIDRKEQVCYQGLAEWILADSKTWCEKKGGVYNLFVSSWMHEAADRMSSITCVFTEAEQTEIHTILLSRR